MPAVANIVIADATPSNRTYGPMSVSGTKTVWVDRSTSNLVEGQSQIILDFSPTSSTRKTDKTTISLSLPKIVVVDGVNTVDSIGRFVNGQFVVPPSWTTTDRAHLFSLSANLMANSFVMEAVTNRNPPY